MFADSIPVPMRMEIDIAHFTLSQQLMSCLAVDYKLGPSTVIGAVRDGASVNGAALRQLMFFLSKPL